MHAGEGGSGKKRLRDDPGERFLYVLARTWCCPVSEVKARLSADELPYWIGLYELDPWGEYRNDVRHAVIGSYLGRVWGGKASPSDLIPQYDVARRGDDEKLARLQWEAFVVAHNSRRKEDIGGE